MMGRGLHTVVDGQSAWPLSGDGIISVMVEAVTLVDMTIIAGPKLEYLDAYSMTGWLILAESHMTTHVRGDNVAVDLYSCKEFDAPRLVEFLVEQLGLVKHTTDTIKRGWAW